MSFCIYVQEENIYSIAFCVKVCDVNKVSIIYVKNIT